MTVQYPTYRAHPKPPRGHTRQPPTPADLQAAPGDLDATHCAPGAMSPRALAQLQRDAGNRAVGRALTGGIEAVAAGPVAQRQPVDVDIIKVPSKPEHTVTELVEDTVEAFQGCLEHYRGALEIFETVVEHSSTEEVAPKAAGTIVLNEVTKLVFNEIKDKILDLTPHGKVVGKVISGTKTVLEAIEKEKKRSEEASESNALKNFIVTLKVDIYKTMSDMHDAKKDDAVAARQKYAAMKPELREGYRDYLEFRNHEVSTLRTTRFSIESLFTRIAEGWVKETNAPGTKVPATVVVTLGRDWTTMSAKLHAPRGSRLAEQLLHLGGGAFDVARFDVPRLVRWYPRSGEQGWGLCFCEARIDPTGSAESASANIFGAPYFAKFLYLLANRPIPPTLVLTGHKTT